ncbi:MAG: HAD family phosphatase [Pseudomonadota bacterium]
MKTDTPDTIVFDIGNVLLDWNPRHLYRKLIVDESERERFLAEICTPDWNFQQDLGRSWKEAVDLLVSQHPDKANLIRAFDTRWDETVAGPITGSVAILEELYERGVPLFAITNFSSEKFDLTKRRYPFLRRFRDIVVSGRERTAKPGRAIFDVFLQRSGCRPEQCLFIDDSQLNVAMAQHVGMHAHHFEGPEGLSKALADHGFPIGTGRSSRPA